MEEEEVARQRRREKETLIEDLVGSHFVIK